MIFVTMPPDPAIEELAMAKRKLSDYKTRPTYETKDRGSFGWGAEITFWGKEVSRLQDKVRAS